MEIKEEILKLRINSDNYPDIIKIFNNKLQYLSYKLNYAEAYTDLIIYLYKLLLNLDLTKLSCDIDIIKYIHICLNNKSKELHRSKKNENNILYIDTLENQLIDSKRQTRTWIEMVATL